MAPANARSGIWVDQEQFPGVAGKPLADAAVSTTVRSTNGVPLVVERAMWWPGDSNTLARGAQLGGRDGDGYELGAWPKARWAALARTRPTC